MLDLKNIRQQTEVTGQQLADALNVSPSTISELENNPEAASFQRIVSYLKQLNYQAILIPEEEGVEQSVLSLLRPRVVFDDPKSTKLYQELNQYLGERTEIFFGANSKRSNEVVRNTLQEATMMYLKDLAHYSFYFERAHTVQTILTNMRKQAKQTYLLEQGYLTVEDYRTGNDHKFKEPETSVTFKQQRQQWVPDYSEDGYEKSVEHAIADDVLTKAQNVLKDTNLIPNKDYYTNRVGEAS